MQIVKPRRMFTALLVVLALVFSGQILQAQVVDRSTLTNKIMCGYQGWFSCPGDGNDPAMGWSHWSNSGGSIGPYNFHTEIWPDITEYDSSDLFFVPNTMLTQGGTPYLFSPYRQGVVNTHFRWMQEYGIDGIFLQRFTVEAHDPNSTRQKHRDQVLRNVMNASTTYGRTFAIEYDISGGNIATLYSGMVSDWTYLKNTFDIKNHPRYLYHNGKPVVIIWGIGNLGTPANMQQIVDWFKADGCFVFGGITPGWRDNTAWLSVYRSLDGITPWTVGTYNSWDGINSYKNRVIDDLTECNSRGILFMPTAWPRFGWDNMHNTPCGSPESSHVFPSRGGQHLWDQVYAFKSAGATCQFIAMFDEYDEGTAIMKCTDNVPTSGCWFTTDGKGNDWFLRLTNQAGKMLRGEIPVSQTIPINSLISPDNAQIISDNIPLTMTTGQQYSVSVTVKNTGETYWNAETFKLGAVGEFDPFYPTSRVTMTPGDTVAPNQQKTFTFTMTAPNFPGTYKTDWQMVHERIRWFGATTSKTITIGANTAPAVVSNFTATINDKRITLNWTNPSDADYTATMIRFRTTGYPTGTTSGTLLCNRATAPGSTDSYTHNNLVNGTTYYYAAFAYDGAPLYSARVTVSAIPADINPPAPTGSFKVIGEDGRNLLSWTNPTDPDFTQTKIVYKTTGFPTSPTDGTLLYSGTGTSYTHTNLTNDTVYYYAAYTFDNVSNRSTASIGSASPAAGACSNEVFAYPNGSLTGTNGWLSATNNVIEVVDEAIKINGGLDTWDVHRYVECSPNANGIIWLQAMVRKGIGSENMWGLWMDDINGENLARWYGSGSTARGRIGPTDSVTAIQTLTGGWDSIAAKVDVSANTTEFFFNGVSLGALSHNITGNYGGDTVSRVRLECLGNANAVGHSVYLDSVFVGQTDNIAPSPVTAFSVIVGNQLNNLMWNNPADTDFAGTMIRYKTTGYPTSVTDGISIYSGTSTSFTHSGLANGTNYYYSAFTFDEIPNYSVKADVSAIPIYFDPAQAKMLANNTPLTLTAGIVSARFTDFLYVQCEDKPIAIRVNKSAHGLNEGELVGVKGTVLTDPISSEKYISALWAKSNGTGVVDPIAMSNAAIGGVNWNYIPATGAGQIGITGSYGANNMGVLVRIWGRVTSRDTANSAYFYIDDGSYIADSTKTGIEDNIGVRVSANPTSYARDSFVIVTGVVSCFKDTNGNVRRMILPKQDGIQKL